MFNQNEISSDEHHNWFVRVKEDSNRQLLIAEDESGLLGFAQFTGVARGGIAEWGFYPRTYRLLFTVSMRLMPSINYY